MTLFPPPLVPGDTIAVIAPSGNVHASHNLDISRSIISEMGFTLKMRKGKWPGVDFLSDSDDARLAEFHSAWSSPDVKAIFALRGGYGALRIMNQINYSLIKNNPKFFFGFSDITILLNRLFFETGLITMHGPVFTSLAKSDHQTLTRVYDCLTGKCFTDFCQHITVIRSGATVEAPLLGGNLSSLVTMLGTAHEPDFSESILLLEDVNEPPYRLDRMITQLFLSGRLDSIKGLILGNFSFDDKSQKNRQEQADQHVRKRLCELTSHLNIPVWADFPSGHCKTNITLPLGATAIMDSTAGVLRFKSPTGI